MSICILLSYHTKIIAQTDDIIVDLTEVKINSIDIPIYFSIENLETESTSLAELGFILGRIFDYSSPELSKNYQSVVLMKIYKIEGNELLEINSSYKLEGKNSIDLIVITVCISKYLKNPMNAPYNITQENLEITRKVVERRIVNTFLNKWWNRQKQKRLEHKLKNDYLSQVKIEKRTNRYRSKPPKKVDVMPDIPIF